MIDPADESVIVKKITKQVQENQRKALIVSPVSLVSAIVLYGRATGGVSFGMLSDIMNRVDGLPNNDRQIEGYGRMVTSRSDLSWLSN